MQQTKPVEGKGVPMINSFLNLCRVCPVPTDDKVNSEYKRNFTWHDGYQASKVEVIKNAPSLPHSGAEPSLPRKKKHPEFAHRTRDLLFDYEEGESSDSLEISTHEKGDVDSRARPEERNASKSRGSPRSRSADSTISRRLRSTAIPDDNVKAAGKPTDDRDSTTRKTGEKQPLMTQSYPPSTNPRGGNPGTPGGHPAAEKEESGGVPKTTEYRSQFVAWPRPQGEEGVAAATARKSASMGLIASQKKDAPDGESSSSETTSWTVRPEEADDDDAALDAVKRGRIKKTEYKSKFRPFSAYTYVDGSWKKATRLIKDGAADDMAIYSSFSFPLIDADFTDNEMAADGDAHAWYSEVVERLKKADQYRVRSHGAAPLYGSDEQQPLPLELFTHVRERTVLSPVSVTSSSRSWKDDRPSKERGRPTPVPVHHSRKERKEPTDSPDHSKSRESSKKKAAAEKTARPKSAEPVIPVAKEKSPKRTRPRAPKDLPVRGHGDLSGKKKSHKQGEKASPMGTKPRAVPRPGPGAAAGVVNGDDGKVWLKPAPKGEEKEAEDEKQKEEGVIVNGYPEEIGKEGKEIMDGELGDEDKDEDSVHHQKDTKLNGQEELRPPITKPPIRVPLTTVKSPEEVTGVRSPDPETWTVPLEIGKGLQWMDGKTPGSVSGGDTADL